MSDECDGRLSRTRLSRCMRGYRSDRNGRLRPCLGSLGSPRNVCFFLGSFAKANSYARRSSRLISESRQCALALRRNPAGPAKVACGHDAGPFHQLRKFIGCRLERQPVGRRLERHYSVHLPTDFEDQVVLPLDLLRRIRERKAVLPDPLDVHRGENKFKSSRSSPPGERACPEQREGMARSDG
jgi:hypothetical protein